MKSFDRKDIAELVGVAAIVVSLVFVGVQMRQTQDIAIAEGLLSVFTLRNDVANEIRNNVGIWRKGVAGEKLPEDDAAVFAILVNQLNEAAVQAYLHALTVDSKDAADFGARDFASFLYHNPGARQLWEEREEYLLQNRSLLTVESASELWTVTVNGYLSTLDSIHPPIDKKPFVDW